MTTANMKLIAVDVPFPDKLEQSAQKLEPGEYIVARIVELAKLADELKGKRVPPRWAIQHNSHITLQSMKERFAIPLASFISDTR